MLSENIKTIRKSKGLSQKELAIKLNVVRQTVSKWEQGLSVPDADLLISLSQALETPVSTLLGGTVPEDGAPGTVREVAVQEQCPLVDLREVFLEQRNFPELICQDGIHPTEQGQELMAKAVLYSLPAYEQALA